MTAFSEFKWEQSSCCARLLPYAEIIRWWDGDNDVVGKLSSQQSRSICHCPSNKPPQQLYEEPQHKQRSPNKTWKSLGKQLKTRAQEMKQAYCCTSPNTYCQHDLDQGTGNPAAPLPWLRVKYSPKGETWNCHDNKRLRFRCSFETSSLLRRLSGSGHNRRCMSTASWLRDGLKCCTNVFTSGFQWSCRCSTEKFLTAMSVFWV